MFRHPLWLVGFRPFFLLAFVSGVLLPPIWAAVFAGAIALPPSGLPALTWHAHEMFYGFGWAVLGGFLLTASKNWVHVRGMHGGPLALAALLWCVERVMVFLPRSPLDLLLLNACTLYVGGYVIWTLLRFRRQDTFPDNWLFVVALPIFLVAKNLLLQPATWTIGISMTLGLFRVAFAVMFERTMTQFMRNAMQVHLPRRRWLDHGIKILLLVAVFESLLPAPVAAAILGAAALLFLFRFAIWSPLAGMRRFEIAIMYLGYLGLGIHLVLAALARVHAYAAVGTVATHAFTLLTMGVIIPGMLIRICQGHTGRKLLFTGSDRIALACMGAAAFLRLVAPQFWPGAYNTWIALSATGWSLCFAIVGLRVGPFLLQPRVDGKEH